jgi:hypothetical protein
MNMRNGLMGRAMSFAHLAGLGGKKASEEDEAPKGKKAKAEDDEDDKSAEDDDDNKESRRAEGDNDDDKSAEDDGDDDDKSAEDDEDNKPSADDGDDDKSADEEEDDSPPPKSKKAKAAKPVTAEFKRGRRVERQRCARIFGDPAAARNPAAAANLAFNHTMSSSAAIALLKTMPAAAGGRRNPDLGADRERTGGGGPQASTTWDRAFAKAGAATTGKPAAAGWDKALGASR